MLCKRTQELSAYSNSTAEVPVEKQRGFVQAEVYILPVHPVPELVHSAYRLASVRLASQHCRCSGMLVPVAGGFFLVKTVQPWRRRASCM